MFSNGPGDPAENVEIIENIKEIQKLGIPIFGICLGHQLMALANGGKTEKLKYGHRGANQPVIDLESGLTYVTSQNHGYAVVGDSIAPSVGHVSHVNANDKTCEGVRADELDLTPSQASSLADLVSIGGDYSGALVVDPIPNTYFTRDDFTIIGRGVSINRMHTYTRRRETLYGEFIFRHHPVYGGAPRWYDRSLPYHIEGGDILILNANTLAVGMSERTEPAAIDLLAHEILMRSETSGIEHIYAFSIPHKRTFMHLDTVFTQVDVDTFTVHPGILGTLRVYELTRGRGRGDVRIRQMEGDLDQILARALGLPAVRLIKCGGGDVIAAAREQWNDGSNTLAVEPGKVFVYQRNSVTNDILYKAGIELLEVPSAELSRGRGGPHCMSMPFWRDDLA